MRLAVTLTILTIFCLACEKPTPPNSIITSNPLLFLENNKRFTIGVVDTTSDVFKLTAKHKYTCKVNSDKSFHFDLDVTDQDDRIITGGQTLPFISIKPLLILNEQPVNLYEAPLNTLFAYKKESIRLRETNVPITTPAGTFICNKFEAIYSSGLVLYIYADKDFKYPFVRMTTIGSGQEKLFRELILN